MVKLKKDKQVGQNFTEMKHGSDNPVKLFKNKGNA